MRSLLLVCCSPLPLLVAAVPRFDSTTLLRDVLVPADASVGSIIYRLRASDPTFDYPLNFTIRGEYTAVSVETLNCTRFNSVCQANVIVRKKLEPSRFYDFTVYVKSVNGASASINCSFRATNATTPWGEIFPGAPTLLMVSEKSRRNTDLGSVIARGNPTLPDPVYLELWGSPQFALHQRLINLRDSEGTIVLLSQLDYEIKTVHHLTVLSNNPYTDTKTDTRNIAGWPLLVVVLDEQDTPPIFTLAPPTTVLNPSLKPGDLVLQVKAEDGDRGKPRQIRYGIIPDGSPFTAFFQIDEETGELHLIRPLSEIISLSHSNQPILLTVVAEEVRENPEESPAQSSTVRLALIPPGVTAGSPTFGSTEYNALLDENSPTGTILKLPQANIQTQPGDVVTLKLLNNNGTFDISPSVVEGQADFQITVHDPKMLDYEARKTVTCDIIAQEIGPGNFTARAKLVVLLNDVNDNSPEFIREEFEGSVQENAEAGTSILRVEAKDIDSEPGNKIQYTALTGPGVNNFQLNPETGIISVKESGTLDAESTPVFHLVVEATDENGAGRKSYANVKIILVDINDQSPVFEKNVYEFIINMERTGFTADAFIKAIDGDISSPNNEIHYEIVNEISGLVLNELSGELGLTQTWRPSDMVTVTARAWDGGIPRLSGICEIRIYPPEANSRKMTFIVPGKDPDVDAIAKILGTITGAKVSINEVRPYSGHEPDATDISRDTDTERSVVVATVNYSKGTIIDVKQIQEILDREYRVRHEKAEIKEASGGDLLWLLLLLIFLLLLLAFILLCCCFWDRCPCYASFNKRRKVRSVEAIKIIAASPGQGHESKSVQVAEWFGRREAWSPEHATLDADSLRRHEMERGSDRSRVHFQKQHQPNEYYVREGNADILRLYTSRENPPQHRPATLVPENAYLPDSGKDILMRRFMEQQHSDAPKHQEVLLPNAAVNKLQSDHEALEASFREQSALLKQILQERERDLKLETQSLPAGTQTDCDAGTQTEPHFLLPPRREVQSNDEQSEDSDEDLVIIKEKVKRRNGHRSDKTRTRRRIRTPIQEESEVDIVDDSTAETEGHHSSVYGQIKHTRTSQLRQNRANENRTQSGIRREVLREISDSLHRQDRDRQIHERDIRDEILLNLSNALNRRHRSRSETRLSQSGMDRDISRDLLNTLSRHNRTASGSTIERDIVREIADSLNRRNELSNLLSRQTRAESESRLSRSGIRREILQELSGSFNQRHLDLNELVGLTRAPSNVPAEKKLSRSSIRREVLREISDTINKGQVLENNSSFPSKQQKVQNNAVLTESDMKTEVLQEIVKSLHKPKLEDSSKDKSESDKDMMKQITENLRSSKKRSSSDSRASKEELKREILHELSAAVDRNELSLSDGDYSFDSLDEVSPNSGDTLKSQYNQKYHSELDLRMPQEQIVEASHKSKSQTNLRNTKKSIEVGTSQPDDNNQKSESDKTKQPKRQSRYMEWYTKNQTKNNVKKKSKPVVDPVVEKTPKELEKTKAKVNQRLLKDTESSARKKQVKKKTVMGPEHPLLQHSEHRYEAQYPRRPEDDADSGIAMTRPPIAQKKSVFTIAYNDMHTSQIQDDAATTPP